MVRKLIAAALVIGGAAAILLPGGIPIILALLALHRAKTARLKTEGELSGDPTHAEQA